MSQLEPTTQAFIDSLAGAKPLYTLTPEAARDVLAGAQKSVSVTLVPARSEDRVLNVGPKGRTNIRIYRPENPKGPLPVVIYTHGGGWVLGDRETHDRLVRERTVGANAVPRDATAALKQASSVSLPIASAQDSYHHHSILLAPVWIAHRAAERLCLTRD
jgi:hypothetical protein